MIIDFHTHTFPDSLAPKAIRSLQAMEQNSPAFTDGTNSGLGTSMKKAGIDVSVLLPIATKPSQTEVINRIAISTNQKFLRTGVLSFGSVHPENENYKEILRDLASHNVKGIKLHPIFQGCAADDPKCMRLIEEAQALGLITVLHAGLDLSMPDNRLSTAAHLLPMLHAIRPQKMVLAHMGSWSDWDGALAVAQQAGCPVWMDTSFVLPGHFTQYAAQQSSLSDTDQAAMTALLPTTGVPPMRQETFIRICEIVGFDHVLFGTDSPWTDQKCAVDEINSLAISQTQKNDILGENAARLLQLSK